MTTRYRARALRLAVHLFAVLPRGSWAGGRALRAARVLS